jgi:adenine-specific DNA glycosylase
LGVGVVQEVGRYIRGEIITFGAYFLKVRAILDLNGVTVSSKVFFSWKKEGEKKDDGKNGNEDLKCSFFHFISCIFKR